MTLGTSRKSPGQEVAVHIRGEQDFGAGMLFVLIGAAGLYFGRELAYGSALQMGPGFFPIWISWIIVGLGLLVMLRGVLLRGPVIERPVLRPIVFVIAPIVLFGFLINRIGLALTTAALAMLSAYARPGVKIKEAAAFSALLGVLATLAFVYGLGQPMPAWWGEP
jgi:hypothetical protein